MIDLYFISFHWHLLLGLFIGSMIGIFIISLVSSGSRSDLEMMLASRRKRIEEQTQLIFELRKKMVEAMGAASSNELRADCLERLKNELQKDYDKLLENYSKLYQELDALKASEVRKFPAPEEIEAGFKDVLKELSTIEEMLLTVKNQKVKLVV